VILLDFLLVILCVKLMAFKELEKLEARFARPADLVHDALIPFPLSGYCAVLENRRWYWCL